ncbi:hypothetical protein [Aestuariivirga sp.]|uniref:hypothetical protein n=1 Tax=Aestuariivirga sp. TaxID=2650926 RepID=UPI00391D9281
MTVIDMFSAPACVIRQYADNIWYALKFCLTIGKRSRKALERPYTDESPAMHRKLNESRHSFEHSVGG